MTVRKALDIQLVAATHFSPPADIDWRPEEGIADGEALIEFAGRACYETFDRPNPRTAANDAYLHHIIEVGHLALLEHATATLYIRGISRAATHELVRHRHFSFSQLSQRYVHPDEPEVVVPSLVAQDEELRRIFNQAVEDSRFMYEELLNGLEQKLASEPNALLRLKQARQAARSVLPNSTESKIVVTGNYRAWRELIAAHATEHADEEMRTVAVESLKILQDKAPSVFSDFNISTLADGTQMASSPFA